MSSRLSKEQVLTELQLLERMSASGATLHDRKIGGEQEPYIEGSIGNIQIWIYHDGEACVVGRGLDRVFELPDFNSVQDLRNAFVEVVAMLVEGDGGA
jgi:hypothetical protein